MITEGSSVENHLCGSLLVTNFSLNLFEGDQKQTDGGSVSVCHWRRLAPAEALMAANNGAALHGSALRPEGVSGMRRDSGASSQAKQACAVLRNGRCGGRGI